MGHVGLNNDKTEFRSARTNTLLHLLWPAVKAQYEQAFESYDAVETDTISSSWRLPQLRRFESDWHLPKFENLPLDRIDEDLDETQSEVEFYWVGSEARIAGTLVHRWLQLIADKRIDGALDDVRPCTLKWLRGMGINNEAADNIAERVLDAVRSTFDDDKGRWLLEGGGAAELALSGVVDGKLTSVILDRVRIDEDGVHWIVDYKTSTHEGGNLDAFLQAEVDRYTPQLANYQQLYRDFANVEVRCALYFPLLKEFVPVTL